VIYLGCNKLVNVGFKQRQNIGNT